MDRYSYEQAEQVAQKILTKGYRQIEKGRNNWVFESDSSILTIPKHQRVKDYKIRIEATRILESRGIPVAKILEYSSKDDGSAEYLLVQKIDGENIDLSKSSQKERAKIHNSAGEILQEIHNIPCSGYGRLTSNMGGENCSWIEFTDLFFQESLRRVKLSLEFYKQFGRVLEQEYQKGRELLINSNQGYFLHADFHLGNLLFKNQKVSAVLDLDMVSAGDSEWDTGHYCHTFNVDRAEGVNQFRKGYKRKLDFDKERFYSLMVWTRKLGSQAIKRPEALNETIPELEKILKGEI